MTFFGPLPVKAKCSLKAWSPLSARKCNNERKFPGYFSGRSPLSLGCTVCTLHCGNRASRSGEHKRGRIPGLIEVIECWREKTLSFCTATGCATAGCVVCNCAVSFTLATCVRVREMACSFKVVEAWVQFVIGREMSWLTLTAVQGSLRKSETLRMLDRPVVVLEDRNASVSVAGKLWPASFLGS